MRGHVFVASTKFGDTRRITDSAAQARSVAFSPDGRRLVFASEVGTSWGLFEASVAPDRHNGLGRLLGMPVAGTGTAVWWERLQDDTVYFCIPQVGFRDERGEFMERALIEPDIRVPNDAEALAAGRDPQIEAAVRALMAN